MGFDDKNAIFPVLAPNVDTPVKVLRFRMKIFTLPVLIIILCGWVFVSGSSEYRSRVENRTFTNNTMEEFKIYLDETFLPIFRSRIVYEVRPENCLSITEGVFFLLSKQNREPRSFKALKVVSQNAFEEIFARFKETGMSTSDADFLLSVAKDCCDRFYISSYNLSYMYSCSSSSFDEEASNDQDQKDQDQDQDNDDDSVNSEDLLTFESVESIVNRVINNFSTLFSSIDSSPFPLIANKNRKLLIIHKYFNQFRPCFLENRTYTYAFNDFPELIDAIIDFYNPTNRCISPFLANFDTSLDFFQECVEIFIISRRLTLFRSLSSSVPQADLENLYSYLDEFWDNFYKIQRKSLSGFMSSFSALSEDVHNWIRK